MIFAINEKGKKIKVESGEDGFCPITKVQLIPVKGHIVKWHWRYPAKTNTDNWSEGETEWHINSKLQFDESQIEFVIDNHRADIKTDYKIIEFQHSPINIQIMKEREDFYGRDLIWVFDKVKTHNTSFIDVYGLSNTDKKHRRVKRNGKLKTLNIDMPYKKTLKAYWRRASKGILMSTKDVWFDFGNTNQPPFDYGEFYYYLNSYEMHTYKRKGQKRQIPICHFLLLSKKTFVQSVKDGTYDQKLSKLKKYLTIATDNIVYDKNNPYDFTRK